MNCKIIMAKDSVELEKLTNEFLASVKNIEIHQMTSMQAEGQIGLSIFYERSLTNLEKVEKHDLEKSLVAHKGEKEKVAEHFGLSLEELAEKMKEFGL